VQIRLAQAQRTRLLQEQQLQSIRDDIEVLRRQGAHREQEGSIPTVYLRPEERYTREGTPAASIISSSKRSTAESME